MADAQLVGVYSLGPEEFPCAVLYLEDRGRFVNVWLPPVEGARLIARTNGWQPTRPHATDVLSEVLADMTAGLETVEMSSFHEGVFTATLQMRDGAGVDARPSDALALALEMDLPVTVDDSVIAAASVWISRDDALRYFDFDVPARSEDASEVADETDDGAFAELMRNLGIDDEDLSGDDGEEIL